MTLDRLPNSASVIEVLDRLIDRGIVIDAWVRLAVAGIDLIAIESRIVVASIDTYLATARSLSRVPPVASGAARPAGWPRTIREQLDEVRAQLEQGGFGPQHHRRFEDRIREERRDARARTLSGGAHV